MTKRGTRAFFVVSTLLSGLLFLGLTIDSHRKIPALTNAAAIDASVIAYTLGISTAIGLVLGLIPVAAVLPANLTTVLRDEGRGGTSGRGAR